jgi:hypothetical protein
MIMPKTYKYDFLNIDPVVWMNNLYKTGLDILKKKSQFSAYILMNDRNKARVQFEWVNEEKKRWRNNVLDAMGQIEWLPKSIESQFASNDKVADVWSDIETVLDSLFTSLEKDLQIIAEAIDLARKRDAQKDEERNNPVPPPHYYPSEKHLVFCNRIIDVTKGQEYEQFCKIMFRNGEPRKKPILFGDMLDKLHVDDLKDTAHLRNLVNNFNNFVGKETGVHDLFYARSKEVYFTTKYL